MKSLNIPFYFIKRKFQLHLSLHKSLYSNSYCFKIKAMLCKMIILESISHEHRNWILTKMIFLKYTDMIKPQTMKYLNITKTMI